MIIKTDGADRRCRASSSTGRRGLLTCFPKIAWDRGGGRRDATLPWPPRQSIDPLSVDGLDVRCCGPPSCCRSCGRSLERMGRECQACRACPGPVRRLVCSARTQLAAGFITGRLSDARPRVPRFSQSWLARSLAARKKSTRPQRKVLPEEYVGNIRKDRSSFDEHSRSTWI